MTSRPGNRTGVPRSITRANRVLRRIWAFALLLLAGPAAAEPDQIAAVPARPTAEAPPRPTLESRLDGLSDRLLRIEEQAGNQGLLSLHNQVAALKAEVARLRGVQEEMVHAQQLADKRQKDVLADFDLRLKEVRELAAKRPAPAVAVAAPAEAPRPAAVAAPAPDPEAETKAYESALGRFKASDYAGAVTAFSEFLARHPDSPLAGNASYWLGLTYFSMADHKSAAATQQRLLKDYPQHAKVPDAMVSLARAQIQLGETENARKVLEQVIAKFPTTKSADLARKILTLFK